MSIAPVSPISTCVFDFPGGRLLMEALQAIFETVAAMATMSALMMWPFSGRDYRLIRTQNGSVVSAVVQREETLDLLGLFFTVGAISFLVSLTLAITSDKGFFLYRTFSK